MKSSPPKAGIDGIVGGSEPKTVSLKREKQEVLESAELPKEDSLDLDGSDMTEDSAEPTQKSTSSADGTEEDHNVVIKLPSFNIPEFKFPNWKNAKSKLPSVKLPKMKVSPKIVITIGLMVMVGGGAFVGLPKAQDYMAVKSALEEAKSLSEIGDYNKAEKTLASALDNWAFGSQKDNLNDLLDKQKRYKASEQQLEEARQLYEEGELESAKNKLAAIPASFPEHELVEEEMTRVEKAIKENKIPADAKFERDQKVQTTINLNVRSTPSVSGESISNQSIGSMGLIKDGPEEGETFRWWKVAYEDGAEGWSAEKYLEAVSDESESGSDEGSQEVSSKFSEGDEVQTNQDAKVRAQPSLSGEDLGVADGGLRGTVVGGPEYGDKLWWWKVEYSDGKVGWSSENLLEPASEDVVETPDPSTKFSPVDKVEVRDYNLSVREKPSLSASVLNKQSPGSTAMVMGGPEYADGIHWWKLRYLDQTEGWSAEDYLEHYTEPENNDTDDSESPEDAPDNSDEQTDEPAEPTYLEEAERIYSVLLGLEDKIVNFVDEYSEPDEFDNFDNDQLTKRVYQLEEDIKEMENLEGSGEDFMISKWLQLSIHRCYGEALEYMDKAESESRGEDSEDSQLSGWLTKAKQTAVYCESMDNVESHMD